MKISYLRELLLFLLLILLQVLLLSRISLFGLASRVIRLFPAEIACG